MSEILQHGFVTSRFTTGDDVESGSALSSQKNNADSVHSGRSDVVGHHSGVKHRFAPLLRESRINALERAPVADGAKVRLEEGLRDRGHVLSGQALHKGQVFVDDLGVA